MATVPHVTSGLGLRKFLTDRFLLDWVYQQSPGSLLLQVLAMKNPMIFVSDNIFGLVDPNHGGQEGTVTVGREWWTSSCVIPISYETSFRGVSVELCHIYRCGLSHGVWLTVICNQLHWKENPLRSKEIFYSKEIYCHITKSGGVHESRSLIPVFLARWIDYHIVISFFTKIPFLIIPILVWVCQVIVFFAFCE
jgi:hypothetical protein